MKKKLFRILIIASASCPALVGQENMGFAQHKGNDNNNEPSNLRVFASQSDHLKSHHGVNEVIPIWDGSKAGQAQAA